jgi:hypothetical protein
VLAGYVFTARRHGFGDANERAVASGLSEAAALAELAHDEPAAMFYAFGRRPRAFPGGWPRMPVLMARNQASAIGLRLNATDIELRPLLVAIAGLEPMPWPEVRRFFAERLVPSE